MTLSVSARPCPWQCRDCRHRHHPCLFPEETTKLHCIVNHAFPSFSSCLLKPPKGQKWQRTQRIVLCSGGRRQLGTKTHVVLLSTTARPWKHSYPILLPLHAMVYRESVMIFNTCVYVCVRTCVHTRACSYICYIHVVRCYRF